MEEATSLDCKENVRLISLEIYLARGEERNGPYSKERIRQFLADGQLDGNELAWFEGCEGWVNVREVMNGKPLSL